MVDLELRPNQIYLGNCMHIMPRIPEDSVDLVLADPPYGINYQSKSRTVRYRQISNDQRPYIWWLQEAQRILKPTGAMVCFTRWDVLHIFASAMQHAGLSVQSCIVWDKGSHGAGDIRRMFAPRHEMALFAIKDKAFAFPASRPDDVIRVPKVNGTRLLHPAEKPIDLLTKLILSTTEEGALVVDPFVGCGSSAIACRMCNRNYIGIEVDEDYVNIARERLEALRT